MDTPDQNPPTPYLDKILRLTRTYQRRIGGRLVTVGGHYRPVLKPFIPKGKNPGGAHIRPEAEPIATYTHPLAPGHAIHAFADGTIRHDVHGIKGMHHKGSLRSHIKASHPLLPKTGWIVGHILGGQVSGRSNSSFF